MLLTFSVSSEANSKVAIAASNDYMHYQLEQKRKENRSGVVKQEYTGTKRLKSMKKLIANIALL